MEARQKRADPSERLIRTCIGKHSGRIASDVSFGEFEHVTINFLGLSRETERLKERPQSIHEGKLGKVHQIDESVHYGDVLVFPE